MAIDDRTFSRDDHRLHHAKLRDRPHDPLDLLRIPTIARMYSDLMPRSVPI
jgi:hypothetical protein